MGTDRQTESHTVRASRGLVDQFALKCISCSANNNWRTGVMPAMHRPRLRFNACRSALHALALPRTQLFVVVRRSSVVCFFCRRRLLPRAVINPAAFSASRSSTSSDYQETQFRETQLSTPRQKNTILKLKVNVYSTNNYVQWLLCEWRYATRKLCNSCAITWVFT